MPDIAAGWRKRLAAGSSPVYLGLVDILAEGIRAGELAAGLRLPPQRDLAKRLGIDVTTVSRAIREAQQRGLIVTRGRAGSFVASTAAYPVSADVIDLSINFPPPLEEDVEQAIREVFVECAEQLDSRELFGYPMRGWSPRHALAGAAWCETLKQNVSPERIAIAGGAQQALLGITSVLCRPGDTILTAALTYPGLLAIARKGSLRIIGVDQDDEGVIPAAVEQACRRAKPRFLYLVPTFQNPTTATAGPERRATLAEVARRMGIIVVEDDGHAGLLEPAATPVSSLIPERSFHVAGLSKCVSPGLRTAYVSTPSRIEAARLNAVLMGLGQFPAPLAAAAAAETIRRGLAARAAASMRRQAAARWSVASLLLPELRAGVSATNHFGWLPLPPRWGSEAFAEHARAHGVGVTPAAAFAVSTPAPQSGVRICLGAADSLDQLAHALQRVAALLSEEPEAIRPYF